MKGGEGKSLEEVKRIRRPGVGTQEMRDAMGSHGG